MSVSYAPEVTEKEESRPIQALARQYDLLVSGGWGVGADVPGWIFGLAEMVFASFDQPSYSMTCCI
jgi:hypothetical protein